MRRWKLPFQLFRPFRSLRARLTLSYILVTVIALLALEGAAIVVLDINIAHGPAVTPRVLAANLERVTPQIAPFLLDPSDPAVVSTLSDWLKTRGLVPLNGSGLLTEVTVGSNSTLVVAGPQGQVLVTWSSNEARSLASAVVERMPQTDQLIYAALAGQTDYSRLSYAAPNGYALAAAPVRLSNKILGVLLAATDLSNVQAIFVGALLKALLPSAILLTILATLIGALFGVLTARGLTTRLRGLARAAAAWSKGDFSAVVRDPSGDELGGLAADLNRMAERLRELLQDQQQLAVVEERNRLARDLHNSVKQQVFATSMQVAAARNLLREHPEAAEARLVEAERLVGEAQRELTSLILELRPAALEGKGLVAALRAYCADWARQTNIAADVRVQGEQPTPLPIEQALFRVAQEALSNVARHSGATTVEVRVTWAGDRLILIIADDGHGVDSAAPRRKGIGLESMRERVEALGGTLTFEGTRPEGGARIRARVPLPTERAPAPDARKLRRATGAGAAPAARRDTESPRAPDRAVDAVRLPDDASSVARAGDHTEREHA